MKSYAVITAVAPQSVAAQASVRVGDVLLAINDQPVRDVIDVQFYGAEAELCFTVARGESQLRLTASRRYGQPLGLDFARPIFSARPRTCRNRCEFCFVNQMLPGLRRSLYLKDDDYRLSFLYGNYITLTNLEEADWERIEEQYLSPLYVSVHATEPEVRRGLMHNARAGQIVADLERLAAMGIEVHTQAVLVPGRNDGAHLERTIADLAELYPSVRDLTIVPVGLTKRHNPTLRPYRDDEAAEVLALALRRQARLRQTLGVGFVYPSDEWYLRAGVPVPERTAYDGLLPDLVENGVGMVRTFLDGWPRQAAELAQLGGPRQTWVTGVLFAPVLRDLAASFAGARQLAVEVVAVPNHAFGTTVTVAGLLTVGDILAELRVHPPADVVVLPGEVFRGPGGLSLDDRSPQEVAQALGTRVHVVRA